MRKNKMKEPKLQLNRNELNLIRFYSGFDTVIYSIESNIEETERNKIGDWEQCLELHKIHLKEMKAVKNRMNKILYPQDFKVEE